jgi:hypothetical protein
VEAYFAQAVIAADLLSRSLDDDVVPIDGGVIDGGVVDGEDGLPACRGEEGEGLFLGDAAVVDALKRHTRNDYTIRHNRLSYINE